MTSGRSRARVEHSGCALGLAPQTTHDHDVFPCQEPSGGCPLPELEGAEYPSRGYQSEAVHLVIATGRRIAPVTAEIDVPARLLGRWVRWKAVGLAHPAAPLRLRRGRVGAAASGERRTEAGQPVLKGRRLLRMHPTLPAVSAPR